MNSRLEQLQPYPFHKLARLLQDTTPALGKSAIRLSVGEPQHAAPAMVLETLAAELSGLSNYPTTRGQATLRIAIAAWATRRFRLDKLMLDPERHILPASGTREALFSTAQAVVDRSAHARPIVMMPNPFYQIYEGAALLAGAEPYYMNTLPESGYRMEFERVPASVWARTQLVYVCSPGNPTGAVMSHDDFARLIELAQRHDFIIASDECYSEIYFDESRPPTGLLQVANDLGIEDYRHCLVFHSLSKRSNLPGLRSGFIAGDGEAIERLFQYRTYHGCSLPGPSQTASERAWNDEVHVAANRGYYREKFDAVLKLLAPVMDVQKPQAGFYLWARTPQDDESFTRGLCAQQNVLVLPGSYLSRQTDGVNPGSHRIRMALVAPLAECVDAARRIRAYIESL
jgi:N-succinyldiaminopimelate aminotransferase